MQHSTGIFLGSEIEQGSRVDSMFQIIPVGLEKSVSYGSGTSNGPAAIIKASEQLETFDQITGEVCKLGICTRQAVDCRDLTADVIQRIRSITAECASNKVIPFILGGEHSITYGALRGIADANNGEKIGIVQFDAHADLRDSYEGDIWSHACVMKRIADDGFSIFQLGVRAISVEEIALRDNFPSQIQYIDAINLCREPRKNYFELPKEFPKKIYITVDIDALDASIMPATGTPVAGGLEFWQLLDLISAAAKGREIVGMDLVEFAPIQGFHAYDFLAADLAYKMMGIAAKSLNKNY